MLQDAEPSEIFRNVIAHVSKQHLSDSDLSTYIFVQQSAEKNGSRPD